ncbi:MAG TPA: adenylate/guanylate cyclase domain-containing protein [Solirubrobacteraceae bacterium]|nr:adenylate/guanylate cyclase domain-containing protein [Solirubrobacteraceae bacterium]
MTKIGALDRYVSRALLRHLTDAPQEPARTLAGTVVFTDLSGFTRLSERLARQGREGAENLLDTINSSFSALLADAYAYGGSMLKFGGDALMLWFDGDEHPIRACASAAAMRATLRRVGRIRTGSTNVVLRMSVGVHSGTYETFLVGGSHREYLVAGPAASTVVEMEAAASSGQILISGDTTELLPAWCRGAVLGPGVLLARAPVARAWTPPETPARPPDDALAACLSTALRPYLLAAPGVPEHRNATVAFLQFGALDGLIEAEGPGAAAEQLDELVRLVQEAVDRYEVCFLDSDIAADGGKLRLSAGAPRAVGDDEERLLLALRQVLEAGPRLPIRIGVNRGHVFTGEIGPEYRRTYALMGDAVNLAARVMAKAPFGHMYATREVLDHSQTSFQEAAVAPFSAKGKKRPLEAWDVGPPRRAAPPGAVRRRLPLIGRGDELELLESAIEGARRGSGTLVEIVGDSGSGKSRLLGEARALAGEMRFIPATCEPYSRDTPYAAWRHPLRQLLGVGAEEPDDAVLATLRGELERSRPELLPWLALIAIAFDVDAPASTEIDELAADARVAKLHAVVLAFLARDLVIPTMLQFENAHHMDAASAALLDAVAQELGSSAWMVMITLRGPEATFASDADLLRIELGPLSGEESRLLAEAAPEAAELPPHVVALAIERAGGSPEFLLDLLASGAGASRYALPDSLGAAAMARIDALEPGDRAVVRRAAVLGLSFHARRLSDVLTPDHPLPDDDAWDRLAGVFARGREGQIRFRRPALQEAASASLPYKLRRVLHAAVAESLEQDQLRGGDVDPAVLSLHYLLAGDYGRAHRYAMLGAERATARFSHADAARLYRRAIEAARAAGGAPGLAHTWERLGDALRCTGEPDAATQALREARRLVGDDPVAQARLCQLHAEVDDLRKSLTAAVRWLNRGLRELEALDTGEATVWRARLRSFLAGVRNRQGRYAEAAALSRETIAEAESVGDLGALARACYSLDMALVGLGCPDQATHSWRALKIYEDLGDPERESAVLNNLGMIAYFQGRWAEAVELYGKAGACSERAGKPGDVAYTDCNVGEILSDQGRFHEATAHFERARRLWTATKEPPSVAFVNLLLGRLALRDGHYDVGLPLLEAGMAELRRFGIDAYTGFARALIAEAEAFAGDPSRGLEIAEEELRGAERHVPLLRRVAGVALCRLGRAEEATRELLSGLEIAREQLAEYEVAATVDVLDALGAAEPADVRERDAILTRLEIERLPAPRLGAERAVGAVAG